MSKALLCATVVALGGLIVMLATVSWGAGKGNGPGNVCAPCSSDSDCDGGDSSLRVKCVDLSKGDSSSVGRCACDDNTTLCEFGVCTDLDSDLDNCGACGNPCDFDAGELCNQGSCAVPHAECNPTDVANLGAAFCEDLALADGPCNQYFTETGAGSFNCTDNPDFLGSEPNPCIENGACLFAALKDGCFLHYEKALDNGGNAVLAGASNCDIKCTSNQDCEIWCNNYARKNGRRQSINDIRICSCAKVCF